MVFISRSIFTDRWSFSGSQIGQGPGRVYKIIKDKICDRGEQIFKNEKGYIQETKSIRAAISSNIEKSKSFLCFYKFTHYFL